MRETWLRVVLWVMAASGAMVGAWAVLAPRSFYDDFPGGGRHWVSADGPFNEHLLRDVGQGTVAVGVVALVAVISGSVWAARATGLAALVANLPHQLYHQAHVSVLPTMTDQVLQSVSLAAVSGAAIALAVLAFLLPAAPASTAPPTTHRAPAPTHL
jgi:hypothetical protein